MNINQTITINAGAEKIYDTLMSQTAFAELTGAPADISPDEGGAFSCFGGQITGRHIELVPNRRIVQAWRVKAWPDGIYSIVKFEIAEADNSSTISLEHTGYPDDDAGHLDPGWHKMYWQPLKAYLE